MRLSNRAIQDFKEIWKEEYGENLSDAQAEEYALRVLRLFQILSHPIPQHHDPYPHLREDETFDNSPPAGTMEEGST